MYKKILIYYFPFGLNIPGKKVQKFSIITLENKLAKDPSFQTSHNGPAYN